MILEEIKVKRELMISYANQHGFTNVETIKCSQELDELINEYHRFMRQSSKPNEEIKFTFKQIIISRPKALVEL